MYLNREEEKTLHGEYGESKRLAMKILCALGDFFHAEKLIRIESAHVSGVSYKTGGDALIDVLEKFAESRPKTAVITSLNPSGMDRLRWREMGVTDSFATKQNKIIELYQSMGVLSVCSCVPYELGNIAKSGHHVSFSESSAVTFMNSFLGAYTNRESGLSALASAIIGKTPEYGLHIPENRNPEVVVEIDAKLTSPTDYGVVGYSIGKNFGSKIPLLQKISHLNIQQAKQLSAAMAASGSISLFHTDSCTRKEFEEKTLEKMVIDQKHLDELKDSLAPTSQPDIIMIGCPHTSIGTLRRISELLKSPVSNRTQLWIFTSRPIKMIAESMGYVQNIERMGARVFCDTCPVVSPMPEFELALTDSAKAAHYLPTMSKIESAVKSLEDCIKIATGERI
ncbi:MAG: aconitase X catalytic domain-containing protein [Candidatus Freyrarchaeum guaymaensis]